ncbi:MAG: copper resistance protein B [Woeseia sp.]
MIKTSALTPGLLLLVAVAAAADERAGTPADWPAPMPAPGPFWMVQGDRLESTVAESGDSYAWELQGWYGYDRQRLRWKTDGEGEWGERPEAAELQLLYSKLFAPYWEWQLGVRNDFRPGDGRLFAVAGLQGTAPYQFEIDSALFVSEDGDLSVRFEAEYDLLITQRLVLQPRLELNLSLSDVVETGEQSGDIGSEIGLRLRYELRRELAPYAGVSFERVDDAGGSQSDVALVAGLHFWF